MKTVIAGLEEGLNAIAEALEGGGGSSIVPTPTAQDEGKVLTAGDDGTASWETPSGGGGIPTPTLDDESKVLKVIPQTQTTVAPEWATIRELPIGGRAGQVLTRSHEGYEWETPNSLPELYDEDNGKVLMAQYDSDTETTYPAWSIIKQVPSGGTVGQVLTKTSGSGYAWQAASGGGSTIYRMQSSVTHDEENDEYVAIFQTGTALISNDTRVLAIYNATNLEEDGILNTISTGYTVSINASRSRLVITFDNNPSITRVELVFATTTQVASN